MKGSINMTTEVSKALFNVLDNTIDLGKSVLDGKYTENSIPATIKLLNQIIDVLVSVKSTLEHAQEIVSGDVNK